MFSICHNSTWMKKHSSIWTFDMTSVFILLIFLIQFPHVKMMTYHCNSSTDYHQFSTIRNTYDIVNAWNSQTKAKLLYHIFGGCPQGKSIKHNFRKCPARIVTSIRDDNDWPWLGLMRALQNHNAKDEAKEEEKNVRTKHKKRATMFNMMLWKNDKQSPIGIHVHITDTALKSIYPTQYR